jgi:hypothetical protein
MVVTVIAWCAGVLSTMALVQAACAWMDRRRFPPPGRMVSMPFGSATEGGVGQRRAVLLHAMKLGAGSPAVVLEAGLATSSLNWSLVQPQLAAFAAT